MPFAQCEGGRIVRVNPQTLKPQTLEDTPLDGFETPTIRQFCGYSCTLKVNLQSQKGAHH